MHIYICIYTAWYMLYNPLDNAQHSRTCFATRSECSREYHLSDYQFRVVILSAYFYTVEVPATALAN